MTFVFSSVVRILPRHLRDLMVLSEISMVHRTLVGTSPLVANIAFLDILKQWPLYGAVLYEVSVSALPHWSKFSSSLLRRSLLAVFFHCKNY